MGRGRCADCGEARTAPIRLTSAQRYDVGVSEVKGSAFHRRTRWNVRQVVREREIQAAIVHRVQF